MPALDQPAPHGFADVHGGAADRRPHAGFHNRLRGLIHVDAAGVGKTGEARLDHLQTGQPGADPHILGGQAALEGNQHAGPGHGLRAA